MTNSECKMTKEIRMTKFQLVIRASSFFRHSLFVIRHSPKSAQLVAQVSNLLYRRLPVGKAPAASKLHPNERNTP